MKITVTRTALEEILNTVKPAVPSKSALPVLQHVYIQARENGIKASATNLDLTITCESLPGEVEITEPGEVVLKHEALEKTIKALRGDVVEIDFKENLCNLRGGNMEAALDPLPAEDFPEVQNEEAFLAPGKIANFQAPVELWKDMLKNLAPFCSTEETRPTVRGVHLAYAGAGNNVPEIVAEATCGARLIHRRYALNAGGIPFDVIIPVDLLKAVTAKDPVDIWIDSENGHAMVRYHNRGRRTMAITRLIDGPYPEVNSAIRETSEDAKLTIERSTLKAMLEMPEAVFPKRGGHAMKLVMHSEEEIEAIVRDAKTDVVFRKRFGCAWTGKSGFTILVDPHFVRTLEKTMASERVTMMIRDNATKPIHLGPEGPENKGDLEILETLRLLMPLRSSESDKAMSACVEDIEEGEDVKEAAMVA